MSLYCVSSPRRAALRHTEGEMIITIMIMTADCCCAARGLHKLTLLNHVSSAFVSRELYIIRTPSLVIKTATLRFIFFLYGDTASPMTRLNGAQEQ